MISFRVAKEQFGWAVQMDQRMTTPFRSRELAVREAEVLANGLRAHGQLAEVIVDSESLADTASSRKQWTKPSRQPATASR